MKYFQDFFRTYPFASVSLVVLGLLIGIRFFSHQYLTEKEYVEEVEKRIHAESRKALDIVFRIKQKLRNGSSFYELSEDIYPYPVYIFHNRKLVFWTDYNFHLGYRDLQGYLIENCIRTQDGIFLVHKTFFNIHRIEYELATVIPIYRKYRIQHEFLRSQYNPIIFPDQTPQITFGIPDELSVYGLYKTYLFSLVFLDSPLVIRSTKEFEQWFAIAVILGFLAEIIVVYRRYYKKYPRRSFAFLAGSLIIGRLFMMWFEFPFHSTEWKLFHPELYASSKLFPSLGDSFLNFFVLLALSLVFWQHYPKLLPYKRFLKLPQYHRFLIACLLLSAAYASGFMMYYILKSLFFNSKVSLDITETVSPAAGRWLAMLIFSASSFLFFIAMFVALKICLKLSGRPFLGVLTFSWNHWKGRSLHFLQGTWGVWSICTLIFGLLWHMFQNPLTILFLIISYAAFFLFRMKAGAFKVLGYEYFLGIVLHAVFCALIAAVAVYYFHQQKEVIEKKAFANKVMVEKDVLAEYFLNRMSLRIQEDRDLAGMRWQDIPKRIKRLYLNRYFDKYDVIVWLFDENGIGLNTTETYENLFQQYQQMQFATEFQNVFIDGNLQNDTKKYWCFIKLFQKQPSDAVGFIVLELKQKKIITYTPSSLFFLDKKLAAGNIDSDIYSYAVFYNQQFLYSYGDYVYDTQLLKVFPTNINVSEYATSQHHHLKITDDKGKTIIITSKLYPLSNILANASTFFLILIFVYLVGIVLYPYTGRSQYSTNFTVKIQLYLNLAFFLPLVVVSILTVSIINKAHTEETKRYYIEKAYIASAEIIDETDALLQKQLDTAKFSETVSEIAKLTQSDINVFNSEGTLLTASQLYMYENNLLATLINPVAYAQLNYRKMDNVIMEESIGDFQYSSVYVSIKSHRDGSILGYIGIPFFGHKFKTDKQIIDVITTIIQLFAMTFIILLSVSYLVAKKLTQPLTIIAHKLRQTDFAQHNQPIEYSSNDEIGLLVNAYNRMLIQLEESRVKLARNEKEMAWREFAKQAAHEIKNPLTPMKLHLQQLQRLLEHEPEYIKKSLASVIAQLDIVSEVISSFSTFAALPLPQEEKFDINEILRNQAIIFSSNPMIDFISDIPDEPYFILADYQQINRIITNLLLNAIQAVPEGRRPEILLRAFKTSQKRVRIQIKDNGSGIPEEIQGKIFLRHFTTKSTGSGIGLSVAKFTIDHIGGNLWFETELNVGTSFFIEIPIVET